MHELLLFMDKFAINAWMFSNMESYFSMMYETRGRCQNSKQLLEHRFKLATRVWKWEYAK